MWHRMTLSFHPTSAPPLPWGEEDLVTFGKMSPMRLLCTIGLSLFAIALQATTRLDSAAQISTWYLERRTEPYTFELTAQVTFLRLSPPHSYTAIGIADTQGAAMIFVGDEDVAQRCKSLRLGDYVTFSGKSIANQAASGTLLIPYVTHLRFLNHGTIPAPPNLSVQDLIGERWHFRTVRIRGILRDAVQSETNPQWTMLVIGSGPNTLYASMPRDASDVSRVEGLIGNEISVTGVYSPFGGNRRERLGPNLAICRSTDLQPISPSSSAPGSEPDLSALGTTNGASLLSLGNHRTAGRISACWRPRHALLQTDDGTLVNLEFAHDRLPACGQWISAVGLPEADFFTIYLDHVHWQPIDPKPFVEPHPESIPVSNIITRSGSSVQINNQYHGHIIQLTGLVRSLANGQAFFETDGELVCVDGSALEDAFRGVSVGCRIKATGVCVMEHEERRANTSFPRLKGFMLVLRTPADLQITAFPPWWTTGRLLAVIGTLLAFLIAIVIWNVVLRRLVSRKSLELFKEQLGHVKAELRTEERTRLAVELHDTLAQNLTGVSMEIEAANDLRGNAPEAMTAHLDIAAKALKSCRDELRNCLWDLRSQALEENDLNQAIRLTLQPHVSDTRLILRFNVPRGKLSDATAHALLMAIRELTVNAIRHGSATEVRIAGSLHGNRLSCSVADNGNGFVVEKAPGILQGHFGLRGIAERIEKLNGEFTIHSTPGKGTKARITL